ncbi:hypothetical protein Droror1_Dr00018850 [Drosera rotundifolia]
MIRKFIENTELLFHKPMVFFFSSYEFHISSFTPTQPSHHSFPTMAAIVEESKSSKPTSPQIVIVNPKPSNGPTAEAIDFVEKLMVKWLYNSKLPQHYLSGNFAPVREETPPRTDLLVKGYLPVRKLID